MYDVYIYIDNRYDRVIEYYAIALIDPTLSLMTTVVLCMLCTMCSTKCSVPCVKQNRVVNFWNQIPSSIKNDKTIGAFKRQYSNFMLPPIS